MRGILEAHVLKVKDSLIAAFANRIIRSDFAKTWSPGCAFRV